MSATFVLVFLIQFLRFYGVSVAPPGFFWDEAAGATQVLCLKETESDFFGNHLPLFSPGGGGGFYTAPYIYGQMAWTSIFGNSIAAFRSFPGFVTVLTLLFFALFLRRSVGTSVTLWFLVLGSISPWSFQFSRIAWDPPLAPFFIGLGMWLFTSEAQWAPWLAGVSFAAAAYSYPPTRLQAILLLLLMPGVSWRQTLRATAVFVLTLIPLLFRSVDADFTARTSYLAIWSPSNPHRYDNWIGLAFGVMKNFLLHLTPNFLVRHGDANLRHSTQAFGMISYPEAAGLGAGFLGLFHSKARQTLNRAELNLVWTGVLGLVTGILPSALTWEGVPHALRSITTWPFLSMLAALAISKFTVLKSTLWQGAILLACAVFFSFYWRDYYFRYPNRAEDWFRTESVTESPLGTAYKKIVEEGRTCAQLRRP
jgi:hypothetical protein